MMRRAASIPTPTPCGKPGTLFQPGIATQLVTSCVTCCDIGRNGMPHWHVGRDKTLDTTQWIKGWILNQLSTRAEVLCEEEEAIRRRRRGGWWADSHRAREFTHFRSGSKLWSLKWSQTVNETLETAKRYAEEALAPLLTWGIADKVEVKVRYINRSVLDLSITVHGPNFDLATTLQGQSLPDYTWLWRAETADQRRAA